MIIRVIMRKFNNDTLAVLKNTSKVARSYLLWVNYKRFFLERYKLLLSIQIQPSSAQRTKKKTLASQMKGAYISNDELRKLSKEERNSVK